MKTSLLVLSLSLSLVLGLSVACQRSPQFRNEDKTGRREFDSQGSFYAKGAFSPTQRVESMGQPKKRVVILNFWNNTPVQLEGIGQFAANELKRGLNITQRVIIPTDTQVELNTQDFVEGDHVRVAQLIREGRKLGVAVLVIGRLKKVTLRQRGDDVGLFRQKQSLVAVDMEAKLFDVQGGRELLASSKSGETSSNAVVAFEGESTESLAYRTELTQQAVRQAVAGFIPEVMKAVEKMTWQGHIAKIVSPKIYVNAGHASGLNSGDILRVLNPGDDIYDPTSGAYLGRSPGQLKGTLEVVDFIGTDGAVTEVHTGGNFHEGDVVQLY